MARPAGPTLLLSKHSRLSRTHLVAAALATLLVWVARTLLGPSTTCRHSNSAAASCGGSPAAAVEPGSEDGSLDATTERMELWLPQGSTHSFRTVHSRCVVHPDGEPPLAHASLLP
jgi:hypothetical protein